jgi:hypothetical protein
MFNDDVTRGFTYVYVTARVSLYIYRIVKYFKQKAVEKTETYFM